MLKRALIASLGVLVACEAVVSFEGLEFGDGGASAAGGSMSVGGAGGDATTTTGGGGASAGGASGGMGVGPGPTTTSTGTGACDNPGPVEGSCVGIESECSSCGGSTCTIVCPGHPKCDLVGGIQCPEGVRCQVSCSGTACDGKTVFCPTTDDSCELICNDAGSCNDAKLHCFNAAICEMTCVSDGSCSGSAEMHCLNKNCVANCGTGVAGPLIDCANGNCTCTGC